METRATLRPDISETKRFVARFGARLVCVRIGLDETELRAAVKRACEIWKPRHRL